MTERNAHLPISKSQALSISRLLNEVPENVRAAFIASAQPLAIARHASLFEHGDAGDTMYVVQQGRIEISILSKSGRKIILNQIPEGHCFGEISMVDKQHRTASAIAVEPSVVLPVTRNTFLKASLACPQLAVNLAEILCERLRWVSASVEEYALFAIDLRLARRLLSMHTNFADEHGHVAATQSDLAEYIGATRESTNKILMQWKSDGLVGLKRGSVQILNPERLRSIAQSEMEN
jgi:CRP/FNR family transcriptional regulator, cyclic AMP receptor protein